MKKVLLTTLLVSTGVLATAVPTFAATDQDSNPVEYSSDLSIKFEKESGSNSEGPFSGRLSFTYAPKDYNFGSQKIKFGTGVSYDLTAASKDSQFIVVNEDRNDDNTEFGKGWNVKVKMDKLTSAANEDKNLDEDTLPAKLILGLGDIQKYNIGTELNTDGDDVNPAKPWDKDVLVDYAKGEEPKDVNFSPLVISDPVKGHQLVVEAGKGEVEIMSQKARDEKSAKREGWGTKINNQTLEFVTLDKKVADREYKSNLTWTMSRDIVAE